MPFFKAENRLVYYAHVPKCGGSAIAYYLEDRFGTLGFYDKAYQKKRAADTAWSATSPQHVDAETMQTLLPLPFFDAMFAVVRHPVPRTVSTYHFQHEVEKRIPADMSFSDWLKDLETTGFKMYEYDNHVLPMDYLVPKEATAFHLEHGLDALVVWLDLLTGKKTGPRVIMPENTRGAFVDVKSEKAVPTAEDLARIGRIYAMDFKRFGYQLENPKPISPPPELTEAFIQERDRDFKALKRPINQLRQRLRRRLRRL